MDFCSVMFLPMMVVVGFIVVFLLLLALPEIEGDPEFPHTRSVRELENDLLSTKRLPTSPKIPKLSWWYTGAEGDHHFIVTRRGSDKNATYRIQKSELTVAIEFQKTEENKRWVRFHSIEELRDQTRIDQSPP